MEAKPADFYAQDSSGSTLEMWIKSEVDFEAKTTWFNLVVVLSQYGSSRRQIIRLNSMEVVGLLALLKSKYDKASLAWAIQELDSDREVAPDAPQFGHILDEPAISPDALADLADKVLTIFETEDAAKATATGTAVGDDGPILDGEVA